MLDHPYVILSLAKAVVLLLLIYCFMYLSPIVCGGFAFVFAWHHHFVSFLVLLLPLWESVIVLCFVGRYFMSVLVLQSS